MEHLEGTTGNPQWLRGAASRLRGGTGHSIRVAGSGVSGLSPIGRLPPRQARTLCWTGWIGTTSRASTSPGAGDTTWKRSAPTPRTTMADRGGTAVAPSGQSQPCDLRSNWPRKRGSPSQERPGQAIARAATCTNPRLNALCAAHRPVHRVPVRRNLIQGASCRCGGRLEPIDHRLDLPQPRVQGADSGRDGAYFLGNYLALAAFFHRRESSLEDVLRAENSGYPSSFEPRYRLSVWRGSPSSGIGSHGAA